MLHFISTGNKFPYTYYIGIKTALKRCSGDVFLHITEEPQSEYFNLLKSDLKLKIEKIDKPDLPVCNMDFYDIGMTDKMKANWKPVTVFDYLIWQTVSEHGGVVMGLDSVTVGDWTHLLPETKEILVSVSPRSKDNTAFMMHGVVAKKGSSVAKKIFADIKTVASGQEIQGKHKAFIDGKARWGCCGIIPYLNNVIANMDKVQVADIKKYTMPLFDSSRHEEIDETYIAYKNTETSKIAKSVLTKEEYDPLCKLEPVKQNKDVFTFHLIGLVHLPQSKEFLGCAFTQKNRKLARMLTSLGHTVYFYGSEGSDVAEYCNSDNLKFVQTHTLNDIRREWGIGDNRFVIGYDYMANGFKHDFNGVKTETTKRFNVKCVEEIKRVSNPDDFLLITQGTYQKPIDDAVKLHLTCEPGIGYRGSYARFRAFESAYIQNFSYGSANPYKSLNGNYYDRVIPNYFDPDDIVFSDKKENYFLYIGRVIKRKGLYTAYLISKTLDIPLIIAGQDGKIDKDGSLYNDFRIPKGNWEYIGFADVEKRKELMAHARATIVATEYLEPFAGTHVESMLSGTPVITTNFGVFPDTVQNGVNGYRCDTLNDFVNAGKNVVCLDPLAVRESAERFLMDNVKYEFQKWFEDLYRVWQSTQSSQYKGWHYIREET